MELHKPKNLYELLTLNMEQRFADRVAFRWYDADQDVVVEKHFGEYAQDIRRAVNYYLSTIPDIQGKRVCVWSNNSYHYAVNCYGVMMAGGVIVPMNQRKSWDELHRELELVEPSAILTDGDDYGCNEEMQAAYGSLLRPMDAYKAYEPACEPHPARGADGADVHLRHHGPEQGRHAERGKLLCRDGPPPERGPGLSGSRP